MEQKLQIQRVNTYYKPISSFKNAAKLLKHLHDIKQLAQNILNNRTENKQKISEETWQNIRKCTFTLENFGEQLQLVYKQLTFELKKNGKNQDSPKNSQQKYTKQQQQVLPKYYLKKNEIGEQGKENIQKQFLYKKKEDINTVYLELFCEFFFTTFIESTHEIFKKGVKEIQNKQVDILYILAVCEFCMKFEIWKKMKFDPQDIVCQPEKNWKELNKRINFSSIYQEKEKFDQKMDQFMHFISLPLSVFSKSNSGAESGIQMSIYQLMLSGFYFLLKNQSINQTKRYLSNPNAQVVLDTWNGMDKVLPMRFWAGANNPIIQQHEILYIHKRYESMTLQQVCKWMREGSIMKKENLKRFEPKNSDIYKETNELEKVQVRLLCNEKLVQKQQNYGVLSGAYKKMANLIRFRQNQEIKDKEEIIIHIHGGGWVAMSSYSHQMYTRRWAKHGSLKGTPIISVDYRLSPKYAYPCALDDCWQVYLFVVNEIQNYFNINPKKIILAGDSAGGNMALGICQLCEKYGVQKPSGLILSYPALNLSVQQFTPSINYSFTDFITPFPFLELCMDLYMKDNQCDPDRDTLLSPLLMSDQMLQKLPKLHIYVGEYDMLKDDQFRFLNRLLKAGHQESQLTIYTSLRHGYLNWDLPFVLPQTRKCGSEAAEKMGEFLFQ